MNFVDNRKYLMLLKKYDPKNFKYEIIDLCQSIDEMDNKETFYIELYDSVNNGYNIRSGGSHGKHSIETKIKMSLWQKGKKLSDEGLNRLLLLGEKHKGVPLSSDHKIKIKESCNKRVITPELSKKYSEAGKKRKNKTISFEHKEILRNCRLGKKLSDETKNKISIKGKGRKHSIETINKMKENVKKQQQKYFYDIVSPTKEVYITKSLISFCKEHNLKYSTMHVYASNKRASNKCSNGWIITRRLNNLYN